MALSLKKIPLYQPQISRSDIDAVVRVLKSSHLSQGAQTAAFEAALAKFVGARHAIAVCNGTAALHVALAALGVKEGDEVITSPFSYVASANAIMYVGARPVFVDIDEDTLNLNPTLLRGALGPRTRAVLPVHVFGRPCEMNDINEFALANRLAVIEDGCEALGAVYQGKKVGTLSCATAFSFFPNKQITTGEGGAVLTSDDRLATLCASLRHQGRPARGESLGFNRLGYNYKQTDLQTALGLSQLRRIKASLENRKRVAEWYFELLEPIEELRLPLPSSRSASVSWFTFVVRTSTRFEGDTRDRILEMMRRRGIECANYFPSIHLQPYFRRTFGFCPGQFPICEGVSRQTIALPFFSALQRGQIKRVADALKDCVFRVKHGDH